MRAGSVKPSEMSYWAQLLLTVLLMMALMIVVVSIVDAIAAELPERWDHLGHEAIEERAPARRSETLAQRMRAASAVRVTSGRLKEGVEVPVDHAIQQGVLGAEWPVVAGIAGHPSDIGASRERRPRSCPASPSLARGPV